MNVIDLSIVFPIQISLEKDGILKTFHTHYPEQVEKDHQYVEVKLQVFVQSSSSRGLIDNKRPKIIAVAILRLSQIRIKLITFFPQIHQDQVVHLSNYENN